MADKFQYVAGQNFYLSGNGVAASDNTIVLKSFKFPSSGDTIVMADFGDIGYGTLEPGTSRREFFSFTGVTQNANGTATLTGVTKGLDAAAPYTEVAGLKKGHAGNSLVRITNAPQFYNKFTNKDNDETITETWTFTNTDIPRLDAYAAPTDDEQLASKRYVDDVAAGGTVSINRIVVAGNAGEAVSAGDLVYLDIADTEWKLVDATDTATLYNVEQGIAQGAGVDGGAIAGGVLTSGIDSNQAGLVANSNAFATDVAGAIGGAAGTNEKIVGIILSATQVLFDPDFGPAPTADEKDALAGTGTPNAANKYVTNDDTSAAPAAGEVIRATGGLLDTAFIGGALTNGSNADSLHIHNYSEKLAISTAITEVTNTTAETDVAAITVPGGTLGTNNAIRLKILFRVSSNVASDDLTIRIKYGATTMTANAGFTNFNTSGLSLYGYLEIYLMSGGATNSQVLRANVFAAENQQKINTTVSIWNNYVTGSSAEDSTGDLDLDVSAQWDAAAPQKNFRVEGYVAEIIR